MLRRLLVVSLLVSLPSVSLGQPVGEKYVSPTSLFYFTFEGFDAHKDAFDKTVSAQVLKGDTGKYGYGLWEHITENLETWFALATHDLELAKVAKDVPEAISSIVKYGFTLSVDARKFDQQPPEVEVVMVLPKNGGKGPLAKLLNKVIKISQADVKELKVEGGATLKLFSAPPAQVGFASVGDTAIFMAGTVDPVKLLRRAANADKTIAGNPLYREVQAFKEFDVWTRGFVDTGSIVKAAATLSPQAGRLTDDLGLSGLKSIKFYSGFDGPAERSVTELHMPGPRKGLLNITKGAEFSIKDLPPLPHDLTSFSVNSFDAPALYDAALQITEGGVRAFSPEAADFVKEALKQAEVRIGVKLRDDLLGSLGDVIVSYNSPSESPFLNLGAVTAIKIKDEKKLLATLQTIQKGFAPPGVQYDAVTRKYRGVTTVELQSNPSFNAQTFTLIDGWLVYANYPQPVHGYILRHQGKLPVWKADAMTAKALTPFPQKFTSFSWSDPKAGAQFAIALLPPIVSAANGATKFFLGPEKTKSFDVSTLPHPLEVTRNLFPHITISTDNGTILRYDTRTSSPF